MGKDKLVLGIIGGSGIYDIDGVENGKWVKATTPYGDPSDEIFTGSLNDINVAFLPRHGRGHLYSPSAVPYQANVYAMKFLGVTDILSISACGSLRKDYKPGEFVIVDQFIDRTFARRKPSLTVLACACECGPSCLWTTWENGATGYESLGYSPPRSGNLYHHGRPPVFHYGGISSLQR